MDPSLTMTTRSLLASGLLALSACGDSTPTPPPSTTNTTGTTEVRRPTEPDISALMALPYAGYVEEDEEVAAREGLVSIDRERSYPGYTLYSVYSLGMAILVDHAGNVVHHWRAPMPSRWAHVELLENGDILTTGIQVKEEDGEDDSEAAPERDRRYALRMSWTGEVAWLVPNSAHHEMTLDPDGRIVTFTAKSRREFLQSTEGAEEGRRRIRDNRVNYLDEEGQTVRSISLYDMLAASPEKFPLITSSLEERKGTHSDLIHANAIEWLRLPDLYDRIPLYGPQHVVISMRHQDRLAIFDLENERLLWQWGLGQISGPHDVQPLENGNLLFLDNGVSIGRSRVVELDPMKEEIVWQWQAPNPTDFMTPTKGSVQRLPNGNTLVANADHGEIFEITRDGDVVWRYLSPGRGENGKRCTLHRARRLEPEFIERLLETHGARPDYK